MLDPRFLAEVCHLEGAPATDQRVRPPLAAERRPKPGWPTPVLPSLRGGVLVGAALPDDPDAHFLESRHALRQHWQTLEAPPFARLEVDVVDVGRARGAEADDELAAALDADLLGAVAVDVGVGRVDDVDARWSSARS